MSIYSGISPATLASWLSEAQTAYHELITGTLVVSVSLGDQRLAFNQAQAPALAAHIRSIQTAIAIASGTTSAARPAVATWNRTT